MGHVIQYPLLHFYDRKASAIINQTGDIEKHLY